MDLSTPSRNLGLSRRRVTWLVVAALGLTGATSLAGSASASAPAASTGTTTTTGTTSAPTVDDVKTLAKDLVEAGATGVVVRIDDGRKVTRFATGAARLVPRRDLAVGDEFRVASITKMFVSTVALQLVAERRLRLDDTVRQLLPDSPGLVPDSGKITLRMLLSHTSGLPDYLDDEELMHRLLVEQPLDRSYDVPAQELIRQATRHPFTFPPGTGYAYSNTGYQVVGLILERATGRRLGALIDQRIARPLGLRHTYLPTSGAFRGRHAHGYVTKAFLDEAAGASPSGTGTEYLDVSARNDSAWADGGMVSTADELARFSTALFSGELLPKAMLREMTTPTRQSTQEGESYGLGVRVYDSECGQVLGHTGSYLGYLSLTYADRHGRSVQYLIPTGPLTTEAAGAAGARLKAALICSMFRTAG